MPLFLKRLKIDSRASFFWPFVGVGLVSTRQRNFHKFSVDIKNPIKIINLKFQFKSYL